MVAPLLGAHRQPAGLAHKTSDTPGDFDRGGFEDIPDEVVSVVVSVFRRVAPAEAPSIALQPTPLDDTTRDSQRTQRKRAATLAHEGRHEFAPAKLKVVPEWPLVYSWDSRFLLRYKTAAKLSDKWTIRKGLTTCNNLRFVRRAWEVHNGGICRARTNAELSQVESRRLWTSNEWAAWIDGGKGRAWFHELESVVRWKGRGTEIANAPENRYGRGEAVYFQDGLAFTMIGATFRARQHRFRSIIGNMGASIYGPTLGAVLAELNSSETQQILSQLNPGTHFEKLDVDRVPLTGAPSHADLMPQLDAAFTLHESHREPSVEFTSPGPSPWRHAQDWAQLAVDRPENTPLPDYVEHLDPEPPTDHLSFALGLALGRFTGSGIVDPQTDDLDAALPHGTLFLDGTLDPQATLDSLGHAACAPLHTAWSAHSPAIDTKRTNLRDYLRLDFFETHRSMYENRPIHWPLSSAKKTFVAWVNIHRWDANTLRSLIGLHLKPALKRLKGHIEDLKAALAGDDAKAAQKADKALSKVKKHEEELQAFIEAVAQCAEHGPPPPDAKTPPREKDAPYDPDLDDGVMVNSSALYPILEAQWKDPKPWWKELALAKGRKDYDWSHLAAKYFPARVDQKCKEDPSLGVAHGCFWKYHPERAYAWELRLQDEIEPGFTIDEDGSDEARAAFEKEHPGKVEELREKEAKRRERKQAKAEKNSDGELFEHQNDQGDDDG